MRKHLSLASQHDKINTKRSTCGVLGPELNPTKRFVKREQAQSNYTDIDSAACDETASSKQKYRRPRTHTLIVCLLVAASEQITLLATCCRRISSEMFSAAHTLEAIKWEPKMCRSRRGKTARRYYVINRFSARPAGVAELFIFAWRSRWKYVFKHSWPIKALDLVKRDLPALFYRCWAVIKLAGPTCKWVGAKYELWHL